MRSQISDTGPATALRHFPVSGTSSATPLPRPAQYSATSPPGADFAGTELIFPTAEDGTFTACSHYSPAQPILDIDADATLLSCPEYVTEIFQHLQEAEVRPRFPLPRQCFIPAPVCMRDADREASQS